MNRRSLHAMTAVAAVGLLAAGCGGEAEQTASTIAATTAAASQTTAATLPVVTVYKSPT